MLKLIILAVSIIILAITSNYLSHVWFPYSRYPLPLLSDTEYPRIGKIVYQMNNPNKFGLVITDGLHNHD